MAPKKQIKELESKASGAMAVWESLISRHVCACGHSVYNHSSFVDFCEECNKCKHFELDNLKWLVKNRG